MTKVIKRGPKYYKLILVLDMQSSSLSALDLPFLYVWQDSLPMTERRFALIFKHTASAGSL